MATTRAIQPATATSPSSRSGSCATRYCSPAARSRMKGWEPRRRKRSRTPRPRWTARWSKACRRRSLRSMWCSPTSMPDEAPRYVDGIRMALAAEMERDEDVVLMGVDVAAGGGVYGATRGLYDRFGPERVMDTPIAEAGGLGAAVGAAVAGL